MINSDPYITAYVIMGSFICGSIFFSAVTDTSIHEKENNKMLCVIALAAFIFFFSLGIIFSAFSASRLFAVLSLVAGLLSLLVFSVKLYNTSQKAVFALLIMYVICMLYIMIFSRFEMKISWVKIDPLETIKAIKTGFFDLRHVLLNVLLFVPFGFLLNAAKFRSSLHIFSIGWLFSSSIETTQLIWQIGECNIYDVFENLVGCIAGVVICKYIILEQSLKNQLPTD